jgi:hypothetical protein
MSDNICLTNNCQYFGPNIRNGSKMENKSKNWEINRKSLFTKMVKKIDKRIERVRTDSYSLLMDSLNNFVLNNSLNDNEFQSNNGLIPTAFLKLGLNSLFIFNFYLIF